MHPMSSTTLYIDKPYQLLIVVFSLYYQLGCYECYRIHLVTKAFRSTLIVTA